MQPVQLPEHRIETRRVADLVPADYNPRKISPKAMEGLKKSLAEFGAVQPIVVKRASLCAVASPIPSPAPVTTATRAVSG